ncbi:MAG: FAD-dependent oxidoreductase [Planctomycetaceae bacterium]|nr:FAD-dependent oxidoreductase [Planctomycetaceae bacterium]
MLQRLSTTLALTFVFSASLSPPASGQTPGDLDTHYDLVVYGSTPGGVACAVRAAREGLEVLMVTHAAHVGGILTSGLSTMDTLYNGARAPLYDELRAAIYEYYRSTYGADSPQYAASNPGHPKTRYEAHVVEQLIEEMLAAESRIRILREHYPVGVAREGALLRNVTFEPMDGGERSTFAADAFADCSYEGDLAAVAGVAYRVGRESREEFHEPHAGVVFLRKVPWPPEVKDAASWSLVRRLNLFRYSEWYELMPDASTGEAHPAVQGFNMRTVVTTDPNNRILPERPEVTFDAEFLRSFGDGDPDHPGLSMPNQKFGMNHPKLVGEQDPYVEGDWAERRRVTQRHREATLALLYFRQNDPSIPEDVRRRWREVGLPKDEFADNGHTPYEIYVREARRIVGRVVFTEHDGSLASGLERAPIHPDSVSVTEWFMDSHACTPRVVEGSEPEGMVMLKNQTFPGQVSYRTLLPREYDNLLTPVCLSSTHVGWGTIRLEPTWMSIAEAAAHAVVMARRANTTPAAIDTDLLVRRLAEERVMLTFFNDVEGREGAVWYPAVQYLGTQGYFGTYDSRPDDELTIVLADAWIAHTAARASQTEIDFTNVARKMLDAERSGGDSLSATVFARSLAEALHLAERTPDEIGRLLDEHSILSDRPITRGDACRLILRLASRKRSVN